MTSHQSKNSFGIGKTAIIYGVIALLLLAAGLLWGCGKLSDDTDRSNSPVGPSGGVPIIFELPSKIGTYELSLTATPTTITADLTNYSILSATLQDTSGRSVEGFSVTWVSPKGTFSESTSLTDSNGIATVRFYGQYSGEAVVQAIIDIDSDGANDIAKTTTVTLTPGGIPSSAGGYTLKLNAYPSSIPADMATYSTISATLTNSNGAIVKNFTITFSADLGYLTNDPQGPSNLSTTTTGLTDENGKSSVYLYGSRAGSAVISATVRVNDLIGPLMRTTNVEITEGAGVPGDGVPGVRLTVDTNHKIADAGTCGEEEAQEVEFTFTARVWDETGDLVGAGVRVELTGSGVNPNVLGDGYTNANGSVEIKYTYINGIAGTYYLSATAHVIINGKEYTDTINYSYTITCTVEEPTAPTVKFLAPITLEVNNSSQTIPVTVQVRVDDNPVGAGNSVLFATAGDASPSISPTTTTTNASGMATATLTLGPISEGQQVIITATGTVSGKSGTAEQTLTATAP